MNIYCENCNRIHEGIYGSGRFCTNKCARSFSTKNKRKEINEKVSNKLKGTVSPQKGVQLVERFENNCIICSKKILTTQKNQRITCKSKLCINEQKRLAGKSSASKRKTRSKLEKEFYSLCARYFNADHNKPIANGWDADVLLPDYKIAILWNGPWHYKEMGMSNHSLKQVVNRDILKIIEFENIGWEVFIYEDNYWTPETALIDVLLKIGRR